MTFRELRSDLPKPETLGSSANKNILKFRSLRPFHSDLLWFMKTLKKCAHENFSVFQTSSNLLPQPYSLLDKKKLSLLTPWMKYRTPEQNMKSTSWIWKGKLDNWHEVITTDCVYEDGKYRQMYGCMQVNLSWFSFFQSCLGITEFLLNSLMLLMIIVHLAQRCLIFQKKFSLLFKFFEKRLVRKSLLINRCL